MTDATQGAGDASGDLAADAAGLIDQILGGAVAQILLVVAGAAADTAGDLGAFPFTAADSEITRLV